MYATELCGVSCALLKATCLHVIVISSGEGLMAENECLVLRISLVLAICHF